MTRHIIRRLIQSIPTLLGITLISYMIITAAPGGPVALLTFGDPEQSENVAARDRLTRQLGLDDPWPLQYLAWLTGNDWMWWKWTEEDYNEEGELDPNFVRYGILRGDFGESFKYRRSAFELIIERMPATIELSIASLLITFLIGVPLGLLAAVWRGGFFDNFTRVTAVLGVAVPNFWLGLILILIFAIQLDLLPAGNRCDLRMYSRTGCPPIYMRLEHLILPTIVIAYSGMASLSRFMRTSMLDTVNSDYVRTARAKGLNQRVVWFRHAARNALIPLATILGPAAVSIFGGSIVIEQIFTWPGISLLGLEALSARDYPIVMANIVIGSLLTVGAYILSDILYAVFDPRIRY